MHQRRFSAIAVGALLLAAPLFSSCGFNYATDRVNTISAGVNNRDADIDVLGSVIIAGEPNAGVFVATLANNSTEDEDSLVSLAAAADDVLTAEPFEPLAVPSAGFVSLIAEGGITVEGEFEVGNFVSVTLTFESGSAVSLDVPVVRPCYQYADIVELPGDTGATEETTEESSEESSESEEGTTTDPYSCDAAESQAH